MATEVRATYTQEVPNSDGGYNSRAELRYTVRSVLGLWVATEWANKRAFKFFTKLETFSAAAYMDAQQQFSEIPE